jgi:hypothetical protein
MKEKGSGDGAFFLKQRKANLLEADLSEKVETRLAVGRTPETNWGRAA